jgi:Rod binding domain-containing protein
MEISASALSARQLSPDASIAIGRQSKQNAAATELTASTDGASPVLKEKFQEFVAGTFYRTLLAEMRKTTMGKSLIHGGRAEEIFQAQMDQTLTERLAASDGAGFSNELFEQFTRQLGIAPGSAGANGQGISHASGAPSVDAGGAGNSP